MSLPRILLTGLMAAAGLLLAVHALALFGAWRVLAAYPYGVDYGEGIVWQQMLNMFAGQGYAPLGVFPAIVYHYPPVYHGVVGGLSVALKGDPLMTGRIVSAFATLASAVVIGLFAARIVRPRSMVVRASCGAVAALAFLATDPVVDWGMLMRVDMLACALSLAGLWFAVRAADRPSLIHLASLCFVLATYTKQVAIAAPFAGIVGLAIGHRRLAVLCLIETAALGFGALAVLEALTGGGFLRHVLLYNVNRTDWWMVSQLIYPVKMHVVLIALAVLGMADLVRRSRGDGSAAPAVLLIFTGTKTLMLLMIVKSGANLNYTIEWFAMISIFAGVALAPVLDYCRGADVARPELLRLVLAGALVLQVSWLPVQSPTTAQANAAATSKAPIVTLIREAKKPAISDDMTLLLRAGKPVSWEPAITAELAQLGRYDEAAFARLIQQHHFAFFVMEGERGDRTFDARYNSAVVTAINAAYPQQQRIAGYTLHFPAAAR